MSLFQQLTRKMLQANEIKWGREGSIVNSDTRQVPLGISILSCLMVFIAIENIWNSFYHSGSVIENLSHVFFFLLLATGLFQLLKTAFFAFLLYFCTQALIIASALFFDFLTPNPKIDLYQCVYYETVKIGLLGWIFYYRRYFFNSTSANSDFPSEETATHETM